MKVRLLSGIIFDRQAWNAGEVIDCDEAFAKSLFRRNRAVPVGEARADGKSAGEAPAPHADRSVGLTTKSAAGIVKR